MPVCALLAPARVRLGRGGRVSPRSWRCRPFAVYYASEARAYAPAALCVVRVDAAAAVRAGAAAAVGVGRRSRWWPRPECGCTTRRRCRWPPRPVWAFVAYPERRRELICAPTPARAALPALAPVRGEQRVERCRSGSSAAASSGTSSGSTRPACSWASPTRASRTCRAGRSRCWRARWWPWWRVLAAREAPLRLPPLRSPVWLLAADRAGRARGHAALLRRAGVHLQPPLPAGLAPGRPGARRRADRQAPRADRGAGDGRAGGDPAARPR